MEATVKTARQKQRNGATPAVIKDLSNLIGRHDEEHQAAPNSSKPQIAYANETTKGIDKFKRYGWSKAVDQPGEFAMIPKGDLRIDHVHYQRDPRGVETILSMAREWSWVACGTISVAMRDDGSYWVMDGQTRTLAALRRSDIQSLPCMVYLMPGLAEEAAGFVRLNTNRRAPNGVEKFKGQVTAGDPQAKLVDLYCHRYGYTVERGSKEFRSVRCMQELLRAAEDHPDALEKVFQIYHDCWNQASIKGQVLKGLMELERRGAADLSDKRLRKRLERLGHDEIVKGIQKSLDFYGKPSIRIYAEGIEKVVNRGLKIDIIDRLKVQAV